MPGPSPAAAAGALFSACLALAPVRALAQAGGHYEVSTSRGSFVPIAGAAVGAVTGPKGAGAGATVPLGFAMKLFGADHREVYVNTHGQVLFGGTSDAPKAYAGGLGDPAAPNGWVSPWWSSGSLSIVSAADLSYEVVGVSGDHVAVFQWVRWGFNGGKRRSMQVALRESTRSVELRYGPIEAQGTSAESALSGAEGPGGEPVEALACDRDVGYLRAGCISSQWPAEGTVVTLTWTPDGPDLVGEASVAAVSDAGGGTLQVAVHAKVRNLGASPAGAFGLQFWAGGDPPLDPASWTLVGAWGAPLSVAGLAEVELDQVVTVARPPGPRLRLGLVVDPGFEVAEDDETNNAAVSEPLAVGVDLAAVAVSGPASAGLGDAAHATVQVVNRGTDAASAQVAVYLVSSGAAVDPARDPEVGRAGFTLGGAGAATVAVDGAVPKNLFAAVEQRFAAVVDPEGLVGDVDRSNDAVAAPQTCSLRAPDLKITRVSAGGPPLFFGDPVEVEFVVANLGEADASDATVGVYLSDNSVVSLADRLLGRVDGLTVAAGGSATATVSTALPATVDGTRPYAAGTWYLGAVADPMLALGETSEGNNALASAPLEIRPAAPDLAALSLMAPLEAAPGEPFPVSLLLANHGVRASAPFGVALGWSANAIPSALDAPLPLLGPDGAPAELRFALAVGEVLRTVAWTALPPGTPPGALWLSLRADPLREVAQLSDRDDAVISGIVQVLPPRVRIVADRALPDLLVGADLSWDLTASGCEGACRWRLVEGAGALPEGISLSASGRLQGAPERAGTWSFAVEASREGSLDVAAFALRVFAPGSNLAVVSDVLPDAVQGVPYGALERGVRGVPLAAVGGVPPYRWRLSSGSALPGGMSLQDGRVAGTPESGTAGAWSAAVEVYDAQGTQAWRALPLRVREQGALSLELAALPAARQGRGYAQPLKLAGAVPPVSVELEGGRPPPPGLTLSVSSQLPLLFGTPAAAGVYPLAVRVSDATGASVRRAYVLLVEAERTPLVPRRLPDAEAGQRYEAVLDPSLVGAGVSLLGGALPPGLALSARGVVEGTVEADARAVSYDFQALVETSSGEAEGAYTIAVRAEPRPYPPARASGCGCRAPSRHDGPGQVLVIAIVLAMALGRSKRRKCV